LTEISVELRGVGKRYGATTAVEHVSLQIRKGEFFSLLGPSGSGKTTTLRLLAGFEAPDEGEILIEGRSMAGRPPNRRPVNLVFQSYALFPHLTVAQNVAFGLEMQRVPRPEISARLESALDMVKLGSKRERYPAQLSGGEQQRVALARALINRPAVLLLDEPLAALDQQLRQEMQVELKAIQERVGITFVCVTHHQEEALTMSDRLAVMDQGRVLQVGTPRDIYESPDSVFVANFIGLSNRLIGKVTRIEGNRCVVRVEELAGLGDIQALAPRGVREGMGLSIVLRPERTNLSREVRVEGFDNTVPGRVAKVLYSGKELQYHLRLAEGPLWHARLANEGAKQKPFVAGESIHVSWNVEDAVVLVE